MDQHAAEIARGERFQFGANWTRFLAIVDDSRIAEAENSLKTMLGSQRLTGKRFLDAGSGSGLLSLAARRLGAVVHSFDYDPRSVECTRELRRRYAPDDAGWIVQEGSLLDGAYLAGLGRFDVVYSWGVLHHTGAMWRALDNLTMAVAAEGQLFIAIYNDQGLRSRYWHLMKRLYVKWPPLRVPIIGVHLVYPFLPSLLVRSITGRLHDRRGMSFWRDVVDWVGGLPFEVATPKAVIDFCEMRGFRRTSLVTTRRHGCNKFVFTKEIPREGAAPTSS
jgi:2-polyprenyl-6-hydroxyphenyl methylase/3-demethylubiquinone-9 3-methyltransferase